VNAKVKKLPVESECQSKQTNVADLIKKLYPF